MSNKPSVSLLGYNGGRLVLVIIVSFFEALHGEWYMGLIEGPEEALHTPTTCRINILYSKLSVKLSNKVGHV